MYLILMKLYVDYTRSLNKVTKQPKYAENSGRERREIKENATEKKEKYLKHSRKETHNNYAKTTWIKNT